MADVDSNLFWELKNRYPEVPDSIVTNYMTKLCNNRERCIDMLAKESPKYLFGGPNSNQNCRVNDQLPHALSDLNIGEHRPRSDSSGSNMSNASSGSSASRPALATSQSMFNVPGYRGPITTFEEHPPTAPVMPNEINQFMDTFRRDQYTSEIPHINCNNSAGTNNNSGVHSYGNRTLNYGGAGTGYEHNPSGNNSVGGSPAVLRPIQVQHIQTHMNENRESPTPGQQSYTYKIQMHPGPVHPGNNMTPQQQQQQGTPSRGWVYHPVSPATSYQNVIYSPSTQDIMIQPEQLQPLPLSNPSYTMNTPGATSPYKSPVDEQAGFGGMYVQGPYGERSQATIYLTNPTISPNSPQFSTVPRTSQQSPLPGQYNPGSLNDVRLSPNPNVMRSHSHNPQQNPQGITGPVLVEIKTPQRAGGVQSQIHYFNTISGPPNSVQGGGSGQQTPQGAYLGHMSPHTETVPSDLSQQAFVSRPFNTPERPDVIFKGATSRDDGGFLIFPPMPNECRVPGHQAGPAPVQKSHSLDSDIVFVSEKNVDYRHVPSQPFMSPASSHSSLSSESSAQRPPNERGRSGSVDDPAYLQALLSHQKSRMDKLTGDVQQAEDRLNHLRSDVTTLESRVIERKRQKSNVFPSSVDLAKLRGDNLQLQADIQLMTREVDLVNNGATPLGVLDPLEQQNFYKNMNTGQRGSIYGNATQTPKTFTSTVTTSVTSTAGHVRPPPEIPPQLPPRDPPRDVPPPIPPRFSAVTGTQQVPPAPPTQPVVNSGDSDADGEQWSCSACTFLNHPALNKCECCEMPRMSVPTPSSPRDVPDSYPSSPASTPTT